MIILQMALLLSEFLKWFERDSLISVIFGNPFIAYLIKYPKLITTINEVTINGISRGLIVISPLSRMRNTEKTKKREIISIPNPTSISFS